MGEFCEYFLSREHHQMRRLITELSIMDMPFNDSLKMIDARVDSCAKTDACDRAAHECYLDWRCGVCEIGFPLEIKRYYRAMMENGISCSATYEQFLELQMEEMDSYLRQEQSVLRTG